MAPASDTSPVSHGPAVKETLIVFDWDDTILPTTWLQRIHSLSGGFVLTHESKALMDRLAVVVTETLLLAVRLGTVILVTNSVPGWVDQSCSLFMPQIADLMKRFPIVARPMRAPLTFKTSAMQREFRNYRNMVSVGDGNAERTASLRLQMAPDMVMGNQDIRSVKSVKLIELPSCQQLHAEHDMLQQRLVDIVGFRGHLDLKSRFPPTNLGLPQNANKVGACSLVHFARPFGASPSMGGGATAWPAPEETKMTGVLSLRTISPTLRPEETPRPAAENRGNSLVGSPAPMGARPKGPRELPSLGGLGGGASGKNTPEPGDSAILDWLRAEERAEHAGTPSEMDGGTQASESMFKAAKAMGGTASTVDTVDGDADDQRSPSKTGKMEADCDARPEPRGNSSGGDGGKRSNTPLLAGGNHWKVQNSAKVQNMERGSPSRSSYTGAGIGKKRPILPTGLRSAGAVWRENSAPAATRIM